MAAAVNQNDLIEIVKAQVDSFNDIITVVVKNSTTINKLDEGIYKATMSAVDYTKNIVNSISGFYNEVQTVESNKNRALLKTLKGFEKIAKRLLRVFKALARLSIYKKRIHIDQIVELIDELPSIYESVKKAPRVGFGTLFKLVGYMIFVGLIGLLATELAAMTAILAPAAVAARLLAFFSKKLASAIVSLKNAAKELIKFTFYMAILMPFLPMTRLGLIKMANIIPSLMRVVKTLIKHVAKISLVKFMKLTVRLRQMITLFSLFQKFVFKLIFVLVAIKIYEKHNAQINSGVRHLKITMKLIYSFLRSLKFKIKWMIKLFFARMLMVAFIKFLVILTVAAAIMFVIVKVFRGVAVIAGVIRIVRGIIILVEYIARKRIGVRHLVAMWKLTLVIMSFIPLMASIAVIGILSLGILGLAATISLFLLTLVADILIIRLLFFTLKKARISRRDIKRLRKLNAVFTCLTATAASVRVIGESLRKMNFTDVLKIFIFVVLLAPLIAALLGVLRIIKLSTKIMSFKKAKKMLRRVARLLAIVAEIAGFVAVLKNINFTDIFKLFMFIILLAPLIAALLGVLRIIKLSMKIMSFRKAARMLRRIAVLLAVLAIIAGIVMLTAMAAAQAAPNMLAIVIFMLALVMLIFIIVLVLKIISKLIKTKVVVQLGVLASLLGIFLLLAVTVLIVGVVAAMALSLTAPILLFIVQLIAITVVLVLIGYLMLSFAAFIEPARLGLFLILMLVGILMLIALALWVLGKLVLDPEKIMENVKTVLKTAGAIVDMIFDPNADKKETKEGEKSWGDAVLTLLGNTVKGIAMVIELIVGCVYLLYIFIAVVLILLIATALRLLQALELDPAKITENVQIVLDTAHLIRDKVFAPEEPLYTDAEDGGFVGVVKTVINWVAQSFSPILQIIQMMMSIPLLLCALVSIFLVFAIAGILRGLQALNLNSEAILANVDTVLEAAGKVSRSVIFGEGQEKPKEDPSKKEKKGFWGTLLDWAIDTVQDVLGPLASIVGALASIPYLLMMLTSIGLVWAIASILKNIQTINLNGVDAGVGRIITAVNTVISKLFGSKSPFKEYDNKQAKKIFKVLNVLSQLADWLDILLNGSNLMVPARSGLKDVNMSTLIKQLKLIPSVSHNTVMAIRNLNNIAKENIDDNKVRSRMSLLGILGEQLKKFPTQMGDPSAAIDNYIKFFDKINTVKLENLKSTERIFAHMAAFAKSINGNFDGLADALNDKIAPLLEELKKLLEEIPAQIRKSEDSMKRLQVDLEKAKMGIDDLDNKGKPDKTMTEEEKKKSVDKIKEVNKQQWKVNGNNWQSLFNLLSGGSEKPGVLTRNSR